ncbi:NUDIX hydrolase [Acanthamoeba polyphaga moumouvirus]|uniref:NUDIX hydrolase n=1 Tax=Acanthamoeba polyphaga moumouvirus TaxID=1269028 RepID=L7RFR2_9VIRU|nr:NUDIX hydrolase [Acanthamoeba polyphaga moumouvirus]AGC01680.1 NUDIX hydrolase [Acanthamoeba polyphaga moumouvirus]AQN68018.1 NUDIx hydrolase [Saudi moumouvirus]
MSSTSYKTVLGTKSETRSIDQVTPVLNVKCITPVYTRKSTKIVKRCGIALLDKDDNVLIVKQNNYLGKWGFPKGHMEEIDEGSRSKCAVREFFEEVNITISSLDCTILQECCYKYIYEKNNVEITIYVLRSEKSYIDIEIKLSAELSGLKWIQYNELKKQYEKNRNYFNVSIFTVMKEYIHFGIDRALE